MTFKNQLILKHTGWTDVCYILLCIWMFSLGGNNTPLHCPSPSQDTDKYTGRPPPWDTLSFSLPSPQPLSLKWNLLVYLVTNQSILHLMLKGVCVCVCMYVRTHNSHNLEPARCHKHLLGSSNSWPSLMQTVIGSAKIAVQMNKLWLVHTVLRDTGGARGNKRTRRMKEK